MALVKIILDDQEAEELEELKKLFGEATMAKAAKRAILEYRDLKHSEKYLSNQNLELRKELSAKNQAVDRFLSAFDFLREHSSQETNRPIRATY